eukprot:3150002-Amphidinium_carterae.1
MNPEHSAATLRSVPPPGLTAAFPATPNKGNHDCTKHQPAPHSVRRLFDYILPCLLATQRVTNAPWESVFFHTPYQKVQWRWVPAGHKAPAAQALAEWTR